MPHQRNMPHHNSMLQRSSSALAEMVHPVAAPADKLRPLMGRVGTRTAGPEQAVPTQTRTGERRMEMPIVEARRRPEMLIAEARRRLEIKPVARREPTAARRRPEMPIVAARRRLEIRPP